MRQGESERLKAPIRCLTEAHTRPCRARRAVLVLRVVDGSLKLRHDRLGHSLTLCEKHDLVEPVGARPRAPTPLEPLRNRGPGHTQLVRPIGRL